LRALRPEPRAYLIRDIYLERHQFGRKNLELLGIPLGGSDLDDEVATLCVSELSHSLTEGIKQTRVGGVRVWVQVANSSDLGRLLGLAASGAARRPLATVPMNLRRSITESPRQRAAAVAAGSTVRAPLRFSS